MSKITSVIVLITFLIGFNNGCTGHHNRLTILPYDGQVAQTPSMVPTINPGQRIHVEAVPFSSIKVGDIIVYWEEARQLNICHRVIAINHGANGQTALVCRGDNNTGRDWHVVTPDMFIGKVTHIYPL